MKEFIFLIIVPIIAMGILGFLIGSSTLRCEPTIDLNQDGKIDIVDYSIFMSKYYEQNN